MSCLPSSSSLFYRHEWKAPSATASGRLTGTPPWSPYLLSEIENLPLIGFAGLGKMGVPMARNLIKSGFSVVLYDQTQAVVDALMTECEIYSGDAIAAKNPLDLVEVDVLFTALADEAALEEVVVDSGLLAAMGEYAETGALQRQAYESQEIAQGVPATHYPFPYPIHVSCETLPTSFVSHQVALHGEHRVEYVAMPVIGRPDAAASAQLHLLFAGSELAREYLQPLLLVPILGQSLRYYGPEPEKANVMEISFNFTLACAIETMAEGSALVQKYGIEPAAYVSLIEETFSTVAASTGDSGGGRHTAHCHCALTDTSLTEVGVTGCAMALEAGRVAGVPLPFAATVVHNRSPRGVTMGTGECDRCEYAVDAERRADGAREGKGEREVDVEPSPLL